MHTTSTATYKITADLAFLTQEWAAGLEQALREHQPKRMELSGNWNDLRPFAGLVDNVESLKIEGTLENGRINAIQGIDAFRSLKRLELVSPVKSGYDATGLIALESIRVAWQPDIGGLLALPNLSQAVISAYPYANFLEFPERSTLKSLGLSQPSITSLLGLKNLGHLREVELSRARKLTSLKGIDETMVHRLEINEARQLVDISCVEVASIESLKLIHVSADVDLSPLARSRSLRRIHVAGKGVPVLPWIDLLVSGKAEWIAGLWNPELTPETVLRNALPKGRQFSRFEPVAGKGVRPLWVEIGAIDGRESTGQVGSAN